MRRLLLSLLTLSLLVPATAGAAAFPKLIDLPNGFQPEGIATAGESSFYVGSIPTGAVYRGDLSTGQGAVLVPPREGRAAIGLKVDRHDRLFVAGGPTGRVFVYDAATGADLAQYTFAPPGTSFINDVIVTSRAAYFTDSFSARLFVVPLGDGGELPAQDDVRELALRGDFQLVDGFNLNGIEATRYERKLIAVQSNTGRLFAITPSSGVTREIDLGGATVPNGDGLLLRGRTLYVVQNQLNQVAVVALSRDVRRGRVVEQITDPAFDVPTTIAGLGGRLYVVNARFGTPPTPQTEYDVVQITGGDDDDDDD